MKTPAVDEHLDTPIEVILGMWPEVAQVFIRTHMGCIGCAFARFHTLQDALEVYQLNREIVIGQMRVLMDPKGDLEPSEA